VVKVLQSGFAEGMGYCAGFPERVLKIRVETIARFKFAGSKFVVRSAQRQHECRAALASAAEQA
jgi:hypothetical protein